MNLARSVERQLGFTLIELMVALGIFLLITGAAFTLLSSSQQRYQTESQVLTSFQEARLGLDQMVRDINDAGFPPPSYASGAPNLSASTPFAWSPGYPTPAIPAGTPCTIGSGGTCATPGDFDLIIETNPNPQDVGSQVEWIRYQLAPTADPTRSTLMRGVAPKVFGADPAAAFTGANAPVPFVQNVVNTPAQPIFSYTCDNPPVPQSPPPPTVSCTSPLAGASNAPANIRDVIITLIVATPQPDATTRQQRLVVLNGRGRRINPNR